MRILLINQFYKPDTAATGQLLADVAERLVLEGHDVSLICSRRLYRGGSEALPRYEEVKGVSIYRVGGSGFGRGRLMGRLIDYLFFYIGAFVRAFRLPRMDVCLCLTTPPFVGFVGVLLSRWRGTRMGLWAMDLYPEIAASYGVLKPASFFYRVLTRMSARLYASSAYVISIGSYMTQRLIGAGCASEKITTIHHWVPGEAVSVLAESGPEGVVTCAYSGNLGMGQHLKWVVRSMAELALSKRPKLLFVGSGAMKKALHDLVEELNLKEVEFRDPVPLEGLGSLLGEGDVHFVMQQEETEGLLVPSKIYSLFAAGRPVVFIGPEACEVADLLRSSEAGFVVSLNKPEQLVDALERLCGDRDLRRTMGEKARAYYEAHLGRKRSVDRIVAAVTLVE